MIVKLIEATNHDAGGMNWGKFMVCRFDETEWAYQSPIGGGTLLHQVGWSKDVLLVIDLQLGEGAIFRPKGLAAADLYKHQIHVCPMFEPFLTWLYEQDVTDLNALPAVVNIDDPASALYGYRRPGSAKEAEKV
jgi:hypothetical protein